MEVDATVFYNGLEQDPRLDHPEGVAVHPSDGSVWCGGEAGQIYRIAPDGSSAEQVADAGGFVLGITFLQNGELLLVCDTDNRCLHWLDTRTGSFVNRIDGVGDHRFAVPNFAVELSSGEVLVSDSGSPDVEGPGIALVRRDGTGEMWHEGPFAFANGIALDPEGRWLYVAETYVRRISRVSLAEAGRAPEPVVATGNHLPDGIAFGTRRTPLHRLLRAEHDPEAGRRQLRSRRSRSNGSHPLPPDQHRLPGQAGLRGEPRGVAQSQPSRCSSPAKRRG